MLGAASELDLALVRTGPTSSSSLRRHDQAGSESPFEADAVTNGNGANLSLVLWRSVQIDLCSTPRLDLCTLGAPLETCRCGLTGEPWLRSGDLVRGAAPRRQTRLPESPSPRLPTIDGRASPTLCR